MDFADQPLHDSVVEEVKTALTRQPRLKRRRFLELAAVSSGGFAVALSLPAGAATGIGPELPSVRQFELNAFVHVGPDGGITLYSHTPEMGQGVKTSIPMIIAEELGADWAQVTVIQAPVNEQRYGTQRAGGSTSTPRNWRPMRQMGAAARHMFIAAAARRLDAPANEFIARNHTVVHQPSGRSLTFAELVGAAAKQKLPAARDVRLKDAGEFYLLGTAVGGVDNPAIVTGKPLFGIDVQLPGMLHAVYHKCPAFFGRVKNANLDEVKKLPGVVDAFVLEGGRDAMGLVSGVAIVARSTWQAFKAREALRVEWDESDASDDSWTRFAEQARELALTRGEREITSRGNVDDEFGRADNTVVESFYTHPYVAHACMEPMNCTAHYKPARDGEPASMEIWAPTQAPSRIFALGPRYLDLPAERVTVHQTRMGGGFGRRGRVDFSSEAALISKRMEAPVKLTWSREDDIQHDFYRAGGFFAMKGAVDEQGKLAAMETHLIGVGRDGEPTSGTRLSAEEFPALCAPNYRAAMSLMESLTPCGPWRAPGSNVTAWAVQSFIAELAHAAGRDHLEFLLEIMGEPRWFEPGNMRSLNTGRASGVIRLAAEKAGWGKQLPKGRGLGLAFHFSHAGHVAEVAEVSVGPDKKLSVHKVTAAVDIGPVINRSGATAQVEGAIIDGFSTMLSMEITMENGRVQQSNFHDYHGLSMRHAPEVDVHFIESDYEPTGIGEPALPPLAPAVGNAIFAATGERVRVMPLRREGFTV
ncbi:molybdopterin cofactor-binding domain-containing protein [Gilvimarinus sp. F26214L]|uniref:molybdopterin cofactor-binding domain-containing protein n=1 Tax=Gilvimarinus sp. DZF01 TaxID=3461371 RepID=UPI004045DA90